MQSYYELLLLRPRATGPEVEAAFRRVVARFRPTLNMEQLLTDPRFLERVNAYLTLSGPLRAAYDDELQRLRALQQRAPSVEAPVDAPAPEPFTDFAPHERQLLLARLASWRREPLEAITLLRTLLQHEPTFARAWALLGEVYLMVDRLEEGIQALQRAVLCDPATPAFSARLAHALDAQAGKVRLKVELSGEEELLRVERLRRWRLAVCLLLPGLALILHAFLSDIRVISALAVPWRTVAELACGMFFLCAGAGYGRWLQPFERVMLMSTMPVLHRGGMRSYPYGLLLFVTAASSLWLCVATVLVLALMDEDWPLSPSIVLGACMVLTLLLTYLVHHNTGAQHWGFTLLIGGNALVIAALLGWWVGSLNVRLYD